MYSLRGHSDTETDDEDSEFELFDIKTAEKRKLMSEDERVANGNRSNYSGVDKQSEEDAAHEQGHEQSSSDTAPQTPAFVIVLSFFSAIGGFLFGYDTGVVSGAMLLLRDQFHLTSIWEEVVVSVTIGFAAIFALVGGALNEAFGRKVVTLLASLVFTGGAVLLGVAQNTAMLVIGRGILGMGIGGYKSGVI